MRTFAPRRIRSHDPLQAQSWTLKRYEITLDDRRVEWGELGEPIARLLADVPPPAPDAGRPGLGFVIAHWGRGADYLVVGWWNAENELPLTVWVRRDGGGWRPASQGESICVWDLEVVWHERQAWVATMMRERPDAEGYLAARLEGGVG